MIANTKTKWIFVGTSKSGSTTIHRFFHSIKLQRDVGKNLHIYIEGDECHWGIKDVYEKTHFTKEDTEHYYKWTVHRNPWDRMVSCYYQFKTVGHKEWNAELLKYKSFEEFILNFNNSPLSNNIRFRPTCDYTDYHGENQMDYVVRFEEFMHGLQHVFSRLELADNISRLTKKTQQADRSSDYRCYYKNNKMINIVGDFFHSDIKRYNDKF